VDTDEEEARPFTQLREVILCWPISSSSSCQRSVEMFRHFFQTREREREKEQEEELSFQRPFVNNAREAAAAERNSLKGDGGNGDLPPRGVRAIASNSAALLGREPPR